MGRFLLSVLVLGLASLAAARPNIVLILADDMGFSDLGSYGGEIRTPVLDSLAGRGARFTQFYNGARCCPTRASLLTGIYAHQAGVGLMTEDRTATFGEGYAGGLNRRCVTMAEALRKAGYATWMVGKWHIVAGADAPGSDPAGWPLQRGFERFFGTLHGGASYFTGRNPNGVGLMSGNTPVATPPGFYLTDNIADTAVRYLDEHFRSAPAKPFFLYTAFTAPHWPLHALKGDIDRYRARYTGGWEALRAERHARQKRLGIVEEDWPLSPPDAPAWSSLSRAVRDTLVLRMAIYAAQVDRMDRNIGKIVAGLRRHGALDSTLIVFLSDNGGCAEGGMLGGGAGTMLETPQGWVLSYGRGWANASNTPFSLYKHHTREGGISTPLIVHWPARIKAGGAIIRQAGHLIDLMPTFLEAAGAAYPKAHQGRLIQPLEGRSLVQALTGGAIGRNVPLFWEHEGNEAVRDGKWKLLSNDGNPWRLFDMEADRTELRDLAASNPTLVAAMDADWQAWAQRAMVLKRPQRVATRIEITAPAGGERLPAGKPFAIHWGATTDTVKNVRLQYQADGGPWVAVADSMPHTGEFAWTVPASPATAARLRIESLDGRWKDTSEVFSVTPSTGRARGRGDGGAMRNPGDAVTGTGRMVKANGAWSPAGASGLRVPGLYRAPVEE